MILRTKKKLIELLTQKKSDRNQTLIDAQREKEAQLVSVPRLKTFYHQGITVLQTFNQAYIIPNFRDLRGEQLKDMASDYENMRIW